MFRKSRIKIVAVMMSVLILLFAGTLCIIYFSSFAEVSRENQEMLRRYAQAYWQNGNPAEYRKPLPSLTGEDLPGERAYRLLSFYSVAYEETNGTRSFHGGDSESDCLRGQCSCRKQHRGWNCRF